MATPKSAPKAVNFVEEATAAVSEAAKTSAAQFEAGVAKAHQQVEEARVAAVKNYEEAAALSQGNLEAVVASGQAAAKGFETFGKALYTYAQSTFEANTKAAEALMQTKSLPEFFQLQSELTQKAFENAMTEGKKLTDLGMQVANDAAKPLTDRIKLVG